MALVKFSPAGTRGFSRRVDIRPAGGHCPCTRRCCSCRRAGSLSEMGRAVGIHVSTISRTVNAQDIGYARNKICPLFSLFLI